MFLSKKISNRLLILTKLQFGVLVVTTSAINNWLDSSKSAALLMELMKTGQAMWFGCLFTKI